MATPMVVRGLWLAVLLVPAAALPARAVEPGGCGVMPVVARSGALVYRLPHTFLRTGSDSVWTRGGPLARDLDYALDRLRGELRLRRAPLEGETLWVRACWLVNPPPLSLQLQRYQPVSAAPDSGLDSTLASMPGTLRPGVARDPYEALGGASLAVNGNKSIAVDFGSSQDAALRQSLDLAVSGTLAPGVTLTGVLSDRNTPLSAEGSTQELQSLDRVLIELQAPQGSASLGDITLGLAETEFAKIERRLQGVRGTVHGGGFEAAAALANAQGEYNRLQFFGVDGQQGPYQLTDRAGSAAITVVAGSEVVVLDGTRMVRGDALDYVMDYDRAQLRFTNRRPISSASRVTVEYQYSLNRFRRNLMAFDGHWKRGTGTLFSRVLNEGDDRARPLDQSLSDEDRLVLASAGDSAGLALAPGVTPGVGDYDTVRVAGVVHFAFAGPDSGGFAVTFARVGAGLGDYADSAVVAGRAVLRYVGPGLGAFRVGRELPLPESHLVWTTGGALGVGPLTMQAEGAVSRLDRNALSSLDDQDNLGGAGHVSAGLAGALPGRLGGQASLSLDARRVGERFESFSRLDLPFAQEDWGLPITRNIDHQERLQADAAWKPRWGGQLHGVAGRLRTPDGFDSRRLGVDWARDGTLATRFLWARARGADAALAYPDGGRDRLAGEIRWRMPWVVPAVRYDSDERSTPNTVAPNTTRYRESGAELSSGAVLPWRLSAGLGLRRDAQLVSDVLTDVSQTRTARAAIESPSSAALGVALGFVRRTVEPLATAVKTRSDLGSVRLRGEQRRLGLAGTAAVEITSDGEARRVREVVYVGPGLGAYDEFGNFVGVGDYALTIALSSDMVILSRTASSAHVGWQLEGLPALAGSRLEFTYETDARRRGEFEAADAAIPPGTVLGDTALARASVLQRLEGELAPGSPHAALRVRLERRVTSDRSFTNFAQTTDSRIGTLRWRARPALAWSSEIEGRVKQDAAGQSVGGGPQSQQELRESGMTAQLVWSPGSRVRAVAAGDAAWTRAIGQVEPTRTLRVGPDLGVSIGPRGRIELTARRAFVSGPPPTALLPGVDPAGAPRIEASGRADYRVRDSITLSLSLQSRAYEGRTARTTGRAEVRAFF